MCTAQGGLAFTVMQRACALLLDDHTGEPLRALKDEALGIARLIFGERRTGVTRICCCSCISRNHRLLLQPPLLCSMPLPPFCSHRRSAAAAALQPPLLCSRRRSAAAAALQPPPLCSLLTAARVGIIPPLRSWRAVDPHAQLQRSAAAAPEGTERRLARA